MLNRRDFLSAAAIASFASGAATHRVLAQPALVKTSMGPTTVDISTGHAGHSSLPIALGYWKEEGLDVNVFGVAGDTAGVQLVSGSKMDFISLGGDPLLAARAKDVPLKAVYMHARMPIGRFVVPKSSGITKVAELKGKTLGMPVINRGTYIEAIFKEAGLDMAKDTKFVATGTGAPALLALKRGDIAGWMSWDTAVAELENRGMEFIEFRPKSFDSQFGNVVVTREEVIRDNPKLIVGLCRGIAKAVHFGLHNPDAAIQMHWKLYPQSKPQVTDEAKLMADSRRVFMARFSSYELSGTNKYGESLPAQWDYAADLMKKQGHLPDTFDVTRAYTNQLIDQINDWDRAAIEAQAKAWTPA
ncbi:MAG: ABC transporter substrate-binding protein [Alphaproteobacteria bacterium]|nr:ABC transporter substrate-binding protein [Alphaproteobacteria bacterium]